MTFCYIHEEVIGRYLALRLMEITYYIWCHKYAIFEVQFKFEQTASKLSGRTLKTLERFLLPMYMVKRTTCAKIKEKPLRTHTRWIMADLFHGKDDKMYNVSVLK